jgi:hypothetical protein
MNMAVHEDSSKSVHYKAYCTFREHARQAVFIDKFGSMEWNIVRINVNDSGRCYQLGGLELVSTRVKRFFCSPPCTGGL